jgi:hypothetical protein
MLTTLWLSESCMRTSGVSRFQFARVILIPGGGSGSGAGGVVMLLLVLLLLLLLRLPLIAVGAL